MKKIVFLGSKTISKECLKILINNQDSCNAEIKGVLTKNEQVRDLAQKNNLPIVDNVEDLLKVKDIDILIVVQYGKILKKEHLDLAKQIAVNLHMAPLPEYRGCNQFSLAIINKDKVFGTTLHKMESEIDSGDIIAERRFKISPEIYVKELYDLTVEHSLKLFSSYILNIIKGEYELIPQEKYEGKRGKSIHYRKEIEELKKIDLSWPREKIERYIRATSMPGFEPPYTIISGKKVYFLPEYLYEKNSVS